MPETTAAAAVDLAAAGAALDLAGAVVSTAAERLAEETDGGRRLDDAQVLAYDLAHAAAGAHTAGAALRYGSHGRDEALLAVAFVADVIADIVGRTAGRERQWGTRPGWHAELSDFLDLGRSPRLLADLAEAGGPTHLEADFELVRESFRRFAEEQIVPRAEHIHRANADIPEEIIDGLAAMGGFGLSVPEEFGGFASGGENDYLGMVVATEELSRASLGAGGSLVTRPEILARALVNGGTEEQKRRLLPLIADGSLMIAVAVTEPDYGSDVASLSVTAQRAEPGGWLVNGVKTWCTFAARADALMLLARTDPDRSKAHRGLSLFVVDKPRGEGHGFVFHQHGPDERLETGDAGAGAGAPDHDGRDAGSPGATAATGAGRGRPAGLPPGRLEGRPIDTIGYRGMHSYELAFENWWVPADNLIGGAEGEGRGFYLQMQGFENGRLQTAARAVGVMQAAYEAGLSYARNRSAGRSSTTSSLEPSSAGWLP